MKHKLFSSILCLLVLCLMVSCKQAPPEQYILNDFDSVQELYSIRPAITLMDGIIDIVGVDSGMVISGSGCARFTYEKGSHPYMILHIQQTACPDLDITAMKAMTLCVYNDNTAAVSGEISLVGTDFSSLLTREFTLTPGQWNTLELPLTADSYDPEQALGFGLLLKAEENSRFYLDRWAVNK